MRQSSMHPSSEPSRSSARLARKRSLDEPCISAGSRSSTNHRPKAGDNPSKNDCGILPGEWYFIKASADPDNGVPWGYVCVSLNHKTRFILCFFLCIITKHQILLPTHSCGWPLNTGDMYGGSHYIKSAAADLTPQGRSILEAAWKFGDGKSLPVSEL